ncbi:hypothetical protein [Streptomyces sp. NPDC056660]|uniref:hypothetical protein n=1 Tax=Streptomyces sp. NPDC056660 TaxID=3345897 RepID=UPI0036B8092F
MDDGDERPLGEGIAAQHLATEGVECYKRFKRLIDGQVPSGRLAAPARRLTPIQLLVMACVVNDAVGIRRLNASKRGKERQRDQFWELPRPTGGQAGGHQLALQGERRDSRGPSEPGGADFEQSVDLCTDDAVVFKGPDPRPDPQEWVRAVNKRLPSDF